MDSFCFGWERFGDMRCCSNLSAGTKWNRDQSGSIIRVLDMRRESKHREAGPRIVVTHLKILLSID
jgi:hypothetical protein